MFVITSAEKEEHDGVPTWLLTLRVDTRSSQVGNAPQSLSPSVVK